MSDYISMLEEVSEEELDELQQEAKEQYERDCTRLEVTKDISDARLRELADAEREGKLIVLNEIFKTPIGQYGFIYYDKQGLMTGDFRDTKEESEAARALAAADAGKGEVT